MGVCLSRRAQDPNHPPNNIAQPPIGILLSQSTTSESDAYFPSSSAGVHAREGRPRFLNEQKNLFLVSNNQRGKGQRHRDERRRCIADPRDLNVLKVDKGIGFQTRKHESFCYKVLEDATRRFSNKNLIGQGGFGDVYKGYLSHYTMNAAKPNEGFPIAVKRIRTPGARGHEEWLNEVEYLSKLSHPNVVKLIGYCREGQYRMLVYEYMTGGSLEDHLLKEDRGKLHWNRRMNIALGAARGLDYLHNYGTPVIHRDIKSSNILLDANFNAKFSDFGLARDGPEGDQSHVSTRILGTRGYFAPEYLATGHLTLKADVYSFGVVLLEILSGSDAVRKHSNGGMGTLAQWAEPFLSNALELHRVTDRSLRNYFPMEAAFELAQLILSCLCLNPKQRPTMAEVVAALEHIELNLGLHYKRSYSRTRTYTFAHS